VDAAEPAPAKSTFLERHRVLGVVASLVLLAAVGILTGGLVGRLLAHLVGLLAAAASGGSP
jgi:hypothetical protein